MKSLSIVCVAAAMTMLGAPWCMAQTPQGAGMDPGAGGQDYQYAPGQFGPNPNVQAYGAYQTSLSAYDQARDASARGHDAYDQQAADYRAKRRAYQMEMDNYQRARVAYQRRYGPGPYAAYNPAPVPPPSPY